MLVSYVNTVRRNESVSHSVVSDSAIPWTVARQAPRSMGFSRQNTGVGCHFLLLGIFPPQGSNLGLLHGRQMLYHLSCWKSPYDDENQKMNALHTTQRR